MSTKTSPFSTFALNHTEAMVSALPTLAGPEVGVVSYERAHFLFVLGNLSVLEQDLASRSIRDHLGDERAITVRHSPVASVFGFDRIGSDCHELEDNHVQQTANALACYLRNKTFF